MSQRKTATEVWVLKGNKTIPTKAVTNEDKKQDRKAKEHRKRHQIKKKNRRVTLQNHQVENDP